MRFLTRLIHGKRSRVPGGGRSVHEPAPKRPFALFLPPHWLTTEPCLQHVTLFSPRAPRSDPNDLLLESPESLWTEDPLSDYRGADDDSWLVQSDTLTPAGRALAERWRLRSPADCGPRPSWEWAPGRRAGGLLCHRGRAGALVQELAGGGSQGGEEPGLIQGPHGRQ
ncbi:unnamed protein product [Arctogadus glacialis]